MKRALTLILAVVGGAAGCGNQTPAQEKADREFNICMEQAERVASTERIDQCSETFSKSYPVE